MMYPFILGLQEVLEEEPVEIIYGIPEHEYCAGEPSRPPSTDRSDSRVSCGSAHSTTLSNPPSRSASRPPSTERLHTQVSFDDSAEPRAGSVTGTPHQSRKPRLQSEPLAPDMLKVQESIYNEVRRIGDAVSEIAAILSDIRDKYTQSQ